ncbi:MAG TPA: fructose PTS transporter subunit IIA [Bacillales bacterium]|nr:fructose PTS transporter subunit IIA [Bacillales bacterium]
MIDNENILFQLEAGSQEEAIRKLVGKAVENGRVNDLETVVEAVLNREKEGTTGFGKGVAIPHGKSSGVIEPTLMFAKTAEGLEWHSMDDKPVEMIFLILVPEESHSEHLQVLAKLARKLMHDEFVTTLRETDEAEKLTAFLEKELA